MHGPPLEVVVWGDYACFTQMKMRGQQMNYQVMTLHRFGYIII